MKFNKKSGRVSSEEAKIISLPDYLPPAARERAEKRAQERKAAPYLKLSAKEQESVSYLPDHSGFSAGDREPPASRPSAEEEGAPIAPYRKLSNEEREKIPYLPGFLSAAARERAEKRAQERTTVPCHKLSAKEQESVSYLPDHFPVAARERAERHVFPPSAAPDGAQEEDLPFIGPYLKTAVAACLIAAFAGLTTALVKGVDTGSNQAAINKIEEEWEKKGYRVPVDEEEKQSFFNRELKKIEGNIPAPDSDILNKMRKEGRSFVKSSSSSAPPPANPEKTPEKSPKPGKNSADFKLF